MQSLLLVMDTNTWPIAAACAKLVTTIALAFIVAETFQTVPSMAEQMGLTTAAVIVVTEVAMVDRMAVGVEVDVVEIDLT